LALPAEQLLDGADFAAIEHSALLLLSAEMSGGLSGVLHVIIEYLTTRKQFDQYIGSYQSLKHPTVQILLSMEACRSHLYRAATCMAQGDTAELEAAVRCSFTEALVLLTNAMPSCFYGAPCGASTSLATRLTTGICWRRCCSISGAVVV
jgi:alkylation response protein AidB-like acyl-CoA dehydrogenase